MVDVAEHEVVWFVDAARTGPSPFAIRQLAPVPTLDFTRSLEVLQAEASKLELLPHPNIVRVIECDRDGRTVFMTMELLTGESLARRMIKNDFRPLAAAEAERITAMMEARVQAETGRPLPDDVRTIQAVAA